MVNETQMKAILILLDDKGHAGWELAKHLDVSDSYITLQMEKLIGSNVICRGNARKSTREKGKEEHEERSIKIIKGEEVKRKGYEKSEKSRMGGYWEIPYYLVRDLEAFKKVIKDIKRFIKSNHPDFLAGFIIKEILESNYAKELMDKVGKDALAETIDDALGKGYNFFIRDFFYKQPGVHYARIPPKREVVTAPLTDLEFWYKGYLQKKALQSEP
jgi:hypothetical protein